MCQYAGSRRRRTRMEHATSEHSIKRTNHSIMSIPRKEMINEARVVELSGIQREEDVNKVSKLSKSCACVVAPIRAYAINRQLKPPARSVVRHIGGYCESLK